MAFTAKVDYLKRKQKISEKQRMISCVLVRRLNKEGYLDIKGGTYWHIYEIDIDFEKVVNSSDMIQELKKQISAGIIKLNAFADELKEKLNQYNEIR